MLHKSRGSLKDTQDPPDCVPWGSQYVTSLENPLKTIQDNHSVGYLLTSMQLWSIHHPRILRGIYLKTSYCDTQCNSGIFPSRHLRTLQSIPLNASWNILWMHNLKTLEYYPLDCFRVILLWYLRNVLFKIPSLKDNRILQQSQYHLSFPYLNLFYCCICKAVWYKIITHRLSL